MNLRPDEPPIDEVAEQRQGFVFRQLLAELDPHDRLDRPDGIARMLGAPIEGGNGFDEGLGIVVLGEPHSIYDNAWLSDIDR